MNALVGSLLAALLAAGFARPRWWLSLGPVAVAVGLTGYRLASVPASGGTSEDAIALAGIVLLAAAMEAALVAGALARAGADRARQRRAAVTAALRAAREIAVVGLAFMATVVVLARATSGMFALLSVMAVAVVLARMWRARLRGDRVRMLGGRSRAARPDGGRGSPQGRRPRTRTDRPGRGRSAGRARP